jgi:hypothetical protein
VDRDRGEEGPAHTRIGRPDGAPVPTVGSGDRLIVASWRP